MFCLQVRLKNCANKLKKEYNDAKQRIEQLRKDLEEEKKKGAKNLAGIRTIDKCETPEEISTYFKEKYLSDIEKLSFDEKKEKYAKLLREFLKEKDK